MRAIVILLGCSIACPSTSGWAQTAGKNHSFEHRRDLEHREGGAEREYHKRAFPQNELPVGAIARGLAQTQIADTKPRPLDSSGSGLPKWLSIGPAPISAIENNVPTRFSGRVAALAV